jgi:hypothetical protein
MQSAIDKAKLGDRDKQEAIKNLSFVSQQLEEGFQPDPASFDKVIQKERDESWKHEGRTVFGKARPPKDGQLELF